MAVGILPFDAWSDRLVDMLSLQTSSSTNYPFADCCNKLANDWSSTSGLLHTRGRRGSLDHVLYTQSCVRKTEAIFDSCTDCINCWKRPEVG